MSGTLLAIPVQGTRAGKKVDSQETPPIILYIYCVFVAGYIGAIVWALRVRAKRRRARIQAWRGIES